MSDILILNPSANLKTVARELSAFGNQVFFARTEDIPWVSPRRVFYFFAGHSVCFTQKAQGEVEKEDRVFNFRSGIFSRIKMWSVPGELSALSPELSSGNLTDLLTFKRGMLKVELPKNDYPVFSDYVEAARSFRGAKVVSSAAPLAGGSRLTFWETDYDLLRTLASDYFVFFFGASRVEAFRHDDKLATVSKDRDPLACLAQAVPSLVRFKFKNAGEKPLFKNYSSWLTRIQTPEMLLVNDYGFFNTSVDMQSSWYVRLASTINFYKIKGGGA